METPKAPHVLVLRRRTVKGGLFGVRLCIALHVLWSQLTFPYFQTSSAKIHGVRRSFQPRTTSSSGAIAFHCSITLCVLP